jgi:hypothetical protein
VHEAAGTHALLCREVRQQVCKLLLGQQLYQWGWFSGLQHSQHKGGEGA